MKPEAQRIAIAEACGWKRTLIPHNAKCCNPASGVLWCRWEHEVHRPIDDDPGHDPYHAQLCLPDYLNSLDAMNEAEKAKEMHWDQKWVEAVVEIALREAAMEFHRTDGWDWVLLVSRLSAAQRAEAFLKTLSLWSDES